jgi:hypothetical protein
MLAPTGESPLYGEVSGVARRRKKTFHPGAERLAPFAILEIVE